MIESQKRPVVTFLVDLFKGREGLQKTFWIWGVWGSIFLTAIYYTVSFAIEKTNSVFFYDKFQYAYSLITVIWIFYISISVIYSASYNRRRGLLGWLASFVAGLGILKAIQVLAVFFGILTIGWGSVEKSVRTYNVGLPKESADGLSLVEVSADRKTRSMTFHYRIDAPTINGNTFDIKKAEAHGLRNCSQNRDSYDGEVKVIFTIFQAIDGTMVELEKVLANCDQ
jgi:hypothetical protein